MLKGVKLDWPRIETPTHWIAIGYDRDLNVAFELLQEQTSQTHRRAKQISPEAARRRMLATWDCRFPKSSIFSREHIACSRKQRMHRHLRLPNEDSPDYLVTDATGKDLNKAMDTASLAMVDKLTTEKHLTRLDAYSLASMAMDCRLGPPEVPIAKFTV